MFFLFYCAAVRLAQARAIASVRPNLVPCFNLVLPLLKPPAHTFRALESYWHAWEGLPCCPVTSRGSSGAAHGHAGEEYQVRGRYQVRANPLLRFVSHTMHSYYTFLLSKRNRSHTQTHDKNNATNDHTKNHPPALNNDRRWHVLPHTPV